MSIAGGRFMRKKFSERLRELRLESNWSQTELADKIGSTQSTITDWERGKKPSLEKVEKLADIFGVSVDYILGRSEKRGIAFTVDEIKELHPELSDYIDKIKEKMGLQYVMWDEETSEEDFWKFVARTAKRLGK